MKKGEEGRPPSILGWKGRVESGLQGIDDEFEVRPANYFGRKGEKKAEKGRTCSEKGEKMVSNLWQKGEISLHPIEIV